MGWKCRGTPLVFLGPATEVFQDWLPKQSVFASVKIPKDNLAASKVEKPTCLASLHTVHDMSLCFSSAWMFFATSSELYKKKKAAILARGKLLFFFFFEDERLVLSHNTVKTCSFLSSYYAPTLNYSNYLNQYSGK